MEIRSTWYSLVQVNDRNTYEAMLSQKAFGGKAGGCGRVRRASRIPVAPPKLFFVKLTSDITTVHATSPDSAMAPRKSKAADRSVPATAWPKSWGSAPQLHDVLTQIARFFDELGYGDARSAIAREAEANGIEVPVIEKGTAAPKHALMQLWRNKSEDSNEGDASQESSDDMESGALVDDEAEETSSDGSNGSSGSEGSAKAGRKRKRVLTPPSSEDDDSLSDSDASGSSSSDDSGSSSNSSSDSSDDSRPARKRAKRSKSSSSSNSSSSNNSSSDSSSDSDSSEY